MLHNPYCQVTLLTQRQLRYSPFTVSSPVSTLHIAITHVIIVLELLSLMCLLTQWQLHGIGARLTAY